MKRLIWTGLTIGGGLTLFVAMRAIAAILAMSAVSEEAAQNSKLSIPLPLLERAMEHVEAKQAEEALSPEGGMTAKESAREYSLDAAIATYEAQLDGLLCSRKAYFLDQARIWQQQTGGSQEHWLLEKLQGIQNEAKAKALEFTTYSGTPEHQAVIRPLAMDTMGVMLALQTLYQGGDTSSCEVMPMPAIAKANEFLFSALEFRQWMITESDHQLAPLEAPGEVATHD